MSAIDIIRSFAEAREEHDEAVINGGITYGVARELLAMHESAERIIAAQPEALALLGAKMAEKDAENERTRGYNSELRAEVERLQHGIEAAKERSLMTSLSSDQALVVTMRNMVQDAEIAQLKDRLRATAQILICEVGADGPMDAEEAARKAVVEIGRERAKRTAMHAEIEVLLSKAERLLELLRQVTEADGDPSRGWLDRWTALMDRVRKEVEP